MNKPALFQEIANNIRQSILSGKLKPGNYLPAVRETAQRLKCAPGTVQKAYQELVRQGLIISRPGQGTFVAQAPEKEDHSPLRKASLIHQTETFLLSQISSGYSVAEIEHAFQIAMDRWRTITAPEVHTPFRKMRFVGSHDMGITILNQHLELLEPDHRLSIQYAGSLGGLIALARQEAELAGCHLWDRETGDYNRPFVQRLLPNRKIALVTLAFRRLGLIIASENPRRISGLKDLVRKEVVFKNRQPGAGTRVWLDIQINLLGISPDDIRGYGDCALTHSEAAGAVASGQADVSLGIESAALAYELGFIPLTTECYELVIPSEHFSNPITQSILSILGSKDFKEELGSLGGYDTEQTGRIRWVE